ncbi:MAG: hypothetical protein UU88_C0017G0007 [Parcubacteria group bacterium GW2011_GWC1_42_11]|uniref:Uncharacterized protein n=1 Tax=Candidatus Nomurabacteria bacterium GW2011_GWC2_42_20 TaxID=1618756 RepID=A0A0G0ZHL1_9BACT|nr:MAG: hypothetical protein UU88_C0017G0007 [Parcubacteria group bacterium GW2011_GWC1_42_11]KKS48215.1 MAG: hypothetical protein UV12_C0002G0064 [Candidatus Nomurabacteria bacterium GW2011_GWC2_42_20]KKS59345.1 MAG: hypothetical protein UV24_C0002G0011 [Candidatus Nomurabacteria bacterium GW2011_GWA2_42_41]KKT09788.1 MAG: hypothetical protein UV86_C0002G0031 [Candidatus Nomurabacteria bacterium GW2011_GWB1_43_20]TAN36095.1 MAG: hypothetical protein EPN27_02325 [Patescibacteria group bacterium
MDQNTNNGAQMPEKKSTGVVISIIIIVLVLAYGAFYFSKQVPLPTEKEVLAPSEIQVDQTISSLSKQGTSTDLADIQRDLEATDFSGLDAGLSDIAI